MNTCRTLNGRDPDTSGPGRPRTPQRGVPTFNLQPSTFSERGLSLIEILVTVALLVVIILGLTAMFNQTRKAFTVGLGNVDYQDAGRVAMDLITRDLQQMNPGNFGYMIPGSVTPGSDDLPKFDNSLNFYADISPGFATNVYWPMTGGDVTNFSLQRLFFVTRYNQQQNAVGYRLISSDATNAVGTLYRYNVVVTAQTNLLHGPGYCFQLNDFAFDPLTNVNLNLSRVIDGVVDFRIRCYDRNGLLIPTPTNGFFVTNYTYINGKVSSVTVIPAFTGNAVDPAIATAGPWIDANTNIPFNTNVYFFNTNMYYSQQFSGDYNYAFYSNAVPAYVDVELGIMESPTLSQLQAFAGTPNYFNFLTNHGGQVHVFRQRISIPAADPAAYP